MNRIAVFLNADKNVSNFYECNHFVVYEKDENGYRIQKTVQFDQIIPSLPMKIRKDVNAVINLIEECDIVAFGKISGVPYSAFDIARYSIFQIPDCSKDSIQGIFDDIEELEKEKLQKEDLINSARPIETEIAGVFYFNLIKLQEVCPEISSKKALLTFFNETPFMELKLICDHIPPWIERDGRFHIKTEKTNEGYIALITFRHC